MDNHIQDVTMGEFVNMFPELTPEGQPNTKPAFGMQESNSDLFSTTTTTTSADSTTETTTSDSTTETTTIEVDILGQEQKPGPGRPPKYIKDATEYFADRIKSGKFVAIQEEVDGKKVDFLPRTPEEFDEVIDLQVDYLLQQRSKELEKEWYQGKSPAWQLVAQYAEMTDDPAEVLPYIQGVSRIQSVAQLDENDPEGAERIVRARLQQKGDTDDIIDMNIESLKTTDKLVETAKKYKPIIVQQEKQQLAEMKRQKEEEERKYYDMVNRIEENARKAIEAPIFGKSKLKQEEKAAIYDLIAVPDDKTGGYPIFAAIDQLFDKGDFDTLKQIALLVSKKDAFVEYISTSAADKTALGLQRKLVLAGESRTHGNDTEVGDQRVVVQRNQYGNPRFGR